MQRCLTRSSRLLLLLQGLVLAVLPSLAADPPSVAVSVPAVALAGLDVSIEVRLEGLSGGSATAVEIHDDRGVMLAHGTAGPGSAESFTLEAVRSPGPYRAVLPEFPGGGTEFSLRVIPGWITLLPPLLAILLALVFRQVVPALFAGVWVGAWIVAGGPFIGALRTIDSYVINALVDADHVAILVFSLMLGGMVGVMARSGGTLGLVEKLRPYATNTRRGQVAAGGIGCFRAATWDRPATRRSA